MKSIATPDYFEFAKRSLRHHWPTMASVNWNDGYKPRCRFCFISCHPKAYGYRSSGLCECCYNELPPIQVIKKEKKP